MTITAMKTIKLSYFFSFFLIIVLGIAMPHVGAAQDVDPEAVHVDPTAVDGSLTAAAVKRRSGVADRIVGTRLRNR